MINIIVTVDYEIFGNGRGDVKTHMIKPMDEIFDICDKHSVNITVFFEVMEYLAFKKYDDLLKKRLGYSPKEEIEKQIIQAYRDGHDIQLHIHPQFRNMRYDGNRFKLDKDVKPYLDLNPDEIEEILRPGMETLESIVKSKDYNVRALRLSNIGWREVPENTIKPMKNLGLNTHSLSDKTPDNKKGYWEMGNEVYEFPIHSKASSYLEFLDIRKLFTYFYIWSHTDVKILNNDKKRKKDKTKDGKDFRSKWDFSKLTVEEMKDYLDLAKERYDHKEHEVPLVMIGHTKDFFNRKNFERFLKMVKNSENQVRFETMNGFIEKNIL